MFEEHFPQVLAMADQEQPFSDEVLRAEWSTFAQTAERSAAIFVVDAAVPYAAVYTLHVEDQPTAAIRDQSDAAPYQEARGRSGLAAAITFSRRPKT